MQGVLTEISTMHLNTFWPAAGGNQRQTKQTNSMV
jgi:hypothetical protein